MKQERNYEHDLIIAYNNAALHRAEKMPKLEKLLGKKSKEKPRVNPEYARSIAISMFEDAKGNFEKLTWEEICARHNGPAS